MKDILLKKIGESPDRQSGVTQKSQIDRGHHGYASGVAPRELENRHFNRQECVYSSRHDSLQVIFRTRVGMLSNSFLTGSLSSRLELQPRPRSAP